MLRFLKTLVSTGLIALLIWSVEWNEILVHLHSVDPTPSLFAVSLLILQYPVSAWKWQKALKLHGVECAFGYLLRVLCIAFFFNNFLPTAIGGDAYRAYRSFPYADRPAYAISTVLVERITGLAALLLLGFFSVFALVANGVLGYKQELLIVSVAAGFLLAVVAIAWKAGLFVTIKKRLHRIHRLEPLMASMRVIKVNRRHFPGLIIVSLLFQLVAILSITCLFSAIALPGRIFESGFAAAVAGVASVIPLSINGIGIVEGSFAIAAVVANLPYAQAVIVALFLRVFGLLSSVAFGILYLFEKSANDAAKPERPSV